MKNGESFKLFSKPWMLFISAAICCMLWGSAFPFIKIGYGLFHINSSDTASQIFFAGIRFALAGVLVIIAGSIISRQFLLPAKKSILHIGKLSLFQTVLQYILFYIGLAHTSGTKGSIINSTSVFFALIISCLFMKTEKLDLKKIAGCIIGFAGTLVINFSRGSDDGISFLGEGFVLLSSVSYAVSSVLIKRYSQNENPVTLSGYQFLFGGLVMILCALPCGARIECSNPYGLLLMLYLAFLSAAAYTLWGILLKYNDVSKVAVFGFMTPVFGCIFSALLLDERIGESALKTICSLILVSAGIIIVNMNTKKGSLNKYES